VERDEGRRSQGEGGVMTVLAPPFTLIDVEQRTPEWHAARLGRLTSSRASDCLATLKSGQEAAGRRNLRIQLVLERITGRSHENGYVSAAMKQGIDREADAVALYEAITGRMLQRTGFLQHTDLLAGASLDGHFNDFEGIAEVKSPLPATHLDYLRTGIIPGEYAKQITHALWISGAQWCDWLSFNPDFPEPLQAKLVRVLRHDVEIRSYEIMARAFLNEVDRETEEVQRMVEAGTAA
jgi:hypothetical protein